MVRFDEHKLRRATSIALACLAVVQMLHTYIPHALHEIAGVLFGVLLVIHMMQHRSWFVALAKGKWNALRVVNTVVVLGLVLCSAAMLISGLAMSGWVVEAGIRKGSISRAVHLPAVHIGFCLLALHAGLQMHRITAEPRNRTSNDANKRAAYVLGNSAVAIFALWSFVDLGFLDYMLGTAGFAHINPSKPLLLSAMQYVAVFALCAEIGRLLNTRLRRQM